MEKMAYYFRLVNRLILFYESPLNELTLSEDLRVRETHFRS